MIWLTHEALKTKPQMRRKVHQVKEGREVLEKLHGKDDTEWRDFAARFNRLDAAVQLQQGAETLETAQLGAPQRRAAVEAKVWATDQGRRCSETPSGQVT